VPLREPRASDRQACIGYNVKLSHIRQAIPEVTRYRDELKSALRPATDEEAALEIEILRSAYFRNEDTIALEKEISRRWLSDLQGVSIIKLRAACKKWRDTGREKAPESAGVLLKGVHEPYRYQLGECQKWLRAVDGLQDVDVLSIDEIEQRKQRRERLAALPIGKPVDNSEKIKSLEYTLARLIDSKSSKIQAIETAGTDGLKKSFKQSLAICESKIAEITGKIEALRLPA